MAAIAIAGSSAAGTLPRRQLLQRGSHASANPAGDRRQLANTASNSSSSVLRQSNGTRWPAVCSNSAGI
jgi:hypothetical protein